MKGIIDLKNLDGNILVSSKEIATNFEKEHKNVVRAIENLTAQNCAVKEMFIETTFNHRGNTYKEYLLNRDGFSLLVMGFTGSKAMSWKLKYIQAFNKMEQSLRSPYMKMSKELQAILIIDEKQQLIEKDINTVKEDLNDFKQDIPLFAVECDEISRLVRKIGTNALNGKLSNAYKDKSIRSKVYSDIYRQLRREFGVTSYKAIKRRQLEQALQSVESYKLPMVLEEEINLINKYESRGDLVC